MKAIMYHYVRREDESLPNFIHLHFDDFRKQLDYLQENFFFPSIEDFISVLDGKAPVPQGAVILTFDDGFSDHYDFVFPELQRRNLWGIFYIPTAPYLTKKLLDVHRIHLLLGKANPRDLLSDLRGLVDERMISCDRIEELKEITYTKQNNSEEVKTFKQILNYYISYEWREKVLDQLMATYFPEERSLVSDFYLNPQEIRYMHEHGMVIGSHSVNHLLLSMISPDQQRREVRESFDFLEKIVGQFRVKTFCYPYGGFHSFNDTTEKILMDNACRFSFNVESRDIYDVDVRTKPMALPRYDCNEFAYGQIRTR